MVSPFYFLPLFAAGCIKGLIGMGLPIFSLAFLGPTLGVREALALIIIPGLATNTWQAVSGPALGMLVRRLWLFLAVACVGIWTGVWVMSGAHNDTMVAVLGIMLILYSVLSILGVTLPHPGRKEPWMAPLMGGLAGVMFGMTGIFIVPGIMFIHSLNLNRHVFVQALGLTFVTITLALLVSLAGNSLMTVDILLMSGLALVPALAGVTLGQRFRHSISEELFRKIFLAGLFVIGLDMLYRTLA